MSQALGPDPMRLRASALVAIAAISGVVLVLLVVLQLQQLGRLNEVLEDEQASRLVHMHRQLAEYLRLREQWALALDEGRPLDEAALSLRYEVWLGRVNLLREDTGLRRLALSVRPDLDQTLDAVDRFSRAADAAVNEPMTAARRRTALASLQPALLGFAPLMRELPLGAAHHAAQEQVAHDRTLSRYSRIALAATVLLALMAAAFAVLALRQMHLLRKRQAAAETLAGELAAARHAAESSSRAKSRFLANMSHEIRTPFQGLLGMLRLLRDTPLEARQVDYLRTATESADHLLAVLTEVLDFSQLEAGHLQLHPTPVSLRRLLREVDTVMQPQAQARGLALRVEVAQDVPDRVRLDETRVKQVLFNLVSNAIKFAGRGVVLLELRLQDADPSRPGLEFAVTDQGAGMDAATLARVFDRFERGDAAVARVEGNGLGLAIARGLAERMDGELQASSTPGQGSRFSLLLPLEPAPEAEAPDAPLATPEHDSPDALDVLVAEDHAVNRQVIGGMLESLGHRAHFVDNGADAVAAVQTRAFDLVLMDLHMPELDGIEATQRIRALPDRRAATLPIVALTADAFTDTRERCLVAGMNSFLSKPVGREKLGAVLRQLFGSACAQVSAAGRSECAAAGGCAAGETSETALIDTQVAARTSRLLGAQRYAQVLQQHLERSVEVVGSMRAAVREAQPAALRSLAHSARGAALELGLAGLAATAQALEDGAAHLPAHEIARLVQRFEEQLAASSEAAIRLALLPATESARD